MLLLRGRRSKAHRGSAHLHLAHARWWFLLLLEVLRRRGGGTASPPYRRKTRHRNRESGCHTSYELHIYVVRYRVRGTVPTTRDSTEYVVRYQVRGTIPSTWYRTEYVVRYRAYLRDTGIKREGHTCQRGRGGANRPRTNDSPTTATVN